MTVSKVYYYERASVFDRALILLLGLACIFLVNMKNNCPPCAQQQLQQPLALQQYAAKPNEGLSSKSSTSSSSSLLKKKKTSGGGSSSSSSGAGEKKFTSSKSVASQPPSGDNLQGKKFIKEGSKWKNKYDIVHIMTTRYMQMQPNLMHLGKARNDLMRVFALPGIVSQSTQEFIWILFTDPELNQELLDEILDMIKPYPNIFLLGMNNGMNNFRTVGWMQNIKKVFSGDMQMLKDYQKASKHRVLLETRLDADDSIFVEMMDSVQKQAADTMGKRAIESQYDPEKLEKEYRIFCTEHHLEWGYFNPWDKKSEKGHLFGVQHSEFCISAGLTYGYQVGTAKEDLPTVSHHRMSVKMPICKKAANNRNCIERTNPKDYKYIMMRSRTPTSAGMLGVIPSKQVVESDTWKHKQDLTWENLIQKNFAIKPQDIWDLRARLKGSMVNILTDALAGQCTKAEFTCKDSTKKDLQTLLDAVKENS